MHLCLLPRFRNQMPRFLCQPRGIHPKSVDARIREDLAAEAGEIAVHAPEQLGVGGEEGEIPGEERLVHVGELAVLAFRGSCIGRGGLERLRVGEGEVAGGELWGFGVGGLAMQEEVVFAAEGRPLLLGFADDAHFREGQLGDAGGVLVDFGGEAVGEDGGDVGGG